MSGMLRLLLLGFLFFLYAPTYSQEDTAKKDYNNIAKIMAKLAKLANPSMGKSWYIDRFCNMQVYCSEEKGIVTITVWNINEGINNSIEGEGIEKLRQELEQEINARRSKIQNEQKQSWSDWLLSNKTIDFTAFFIDDCTFCFFRGPWICETKITGSQFHEFNEEALPLPTDA